MARRWKVRKLGTDAWLFYHPDCPARSHVCWRGVVRGILCGVRYTLRDAHRAAEHRHAMEVYVGVVDRAELAAMIRPGAPTK